MLLDISDRLDEALAAAEKMGVFVRAEPLGGDGGGVCRIRDATVLFVDTMADVATRYRRVLEALAGLPGIDAQFLRPEIRTDIERVRGER